jgi:transposase
VSEDDDVTGNRAVRLMGARVRDLERQLGRKTREVEIEVEILKEALDKSRSKKRMWLAQSRLKGGSRRRRWPRRRACPGRT